MGPSSHRPPRQERSRRTLERLLDATEALLATRPFAEIAIQEITAAAECSIGSFYARFDSKEALLPLLYARYDAALADRLEQRFAAVDWSTLSLKETCERLVADMVEMYQERRHLMRAMVLFARTHPDQLPIDVQQRRQPLHERPVAVLARFAAEIPHVDASNAARVGLFVVAAAAREQLLFRNAPHARVTAIASTRLRSELTHMLYAYLSIAPP